MVRIKEPFIFLGRGGKERAGQGRGAGGFCNFLGKKSRAP